MIKRITFGFHKWLKQRLRMKERLFLSLSFCTACRSEANKTKHTGFIFIKHVTKDWLPVCLRSLIELVLLARKEREREGRQRRRIDALRQSSNFTGCLVVLIFCVDRSTLEDKSIGSVWRTWSVTDQPETSGRETKKERKGGRERARGTFLLSKLMCIYTLEYANLINIINCLLAIRSSSLSISVCIIQWHDDNASRFSFVRERDDIFVSAALLLIISVRLSPFTHA